MKRPVAALALSLSLGACGNPSPAPSQPAGGGAGSTSTGASGGDTAAGSGGVNPDGGVSAVGCSPEGGAGAYGGNTAGAWSGAGAGAGTGGSASALVWPNESRANSDTWLSENHDRITQLRPRVLVIDLENTADAQAQVDKHIAALKHASSPHQFKDPAAQPTVAYELVEIAHAAKGGSAIVDYASWNTQAFADATFPGPGTLAKNDDGTPMRDWWVYLFY